MHFVRSLITGGEPTQCVRDTASGTALSWALSYGSRSFGMVYTTATARRRGLARMCVTALLQKMLEAQRRRQGGDGEHSGGGNCGGERAADGSEEGELDVCWAPYCYVVVGNESSLALLAGLGVRPVDKDPRFTWTGFTRPT